MNIPLNYQISEYDCGPTTVLNAISFLFSRKEIQPDLIKFLQMYCLDSFNSRGELGKKGTSNFAMNFIGNWLNQYGKTHKLPIHCEIPTNDEIYISKNSRIVAALQQGGCAIVRVYLGVPHYVLLTGMEGDKILVFDPYFLEKDIRRKGIETIKDAPDRMNRKVDSSLFNTEKRSYYSLGEKDTRECIILYNSKTRTTDSVEYII
ncbi:MAG TPA: peptidase C39 [Lachnospiraceae bacterium]|nr:peptidase C39 [Lachnospiraceae bacterium]HEX3075312.1 peptidase C39 [Lachnospiraceae bacterium]